MMCQMGQHYYRHADGKAGDVYKGMCFILAEVAQRGREIVSEHAFDFGFG